MFFPATPSSGNHQPFLVSVSLFVFLCLIPGISHISESIQVLSFSVWFILQFIAPSKVIRVVTKGKASFISYFWVILYLYIFIYICLLEIQVWSLSWESLGGGTSSTLAQLIDVVWSCSPGLLSWTRDGCSQWTCPLLVCPLGPSPVFPPADRGGWGRQRLGAASGPGLQAPVPRLRALVGPFIFWHSRCCCFAFSCAPPAALPALGRAVPLPRCFEVGLPWWLRG